MRLWTSWSCCNTFDLIMKKTFNLLFWYPKIQSTDLYSWQRLQQFKITKMEWRVTYFKLRLILKMIKKFYSLFSKSTKIIYITLSDLNGKKIFQKISVKGLLKTQNSENKIIQIDFRREKIDSKEKNLFVLFWLKFWRQALLLKFTIKSNQIEIQ